MIRYRYNSQVTPPAPFLHVTVRSVDGSLALGDLPAQIDSGASRTVVPRSAVQALGLIALDQILIGGVGGAVISMPTFLLQVEIRQLRAVVLEVVAHEQEPFSLDATS